MSLQKRMPGDREAVQLLVRFPDDAVIVSRCMVYVLFGYEMMKAFLLATLARIFFGRTGDNIYGIV